MSAALQGKEAAMFLPSGTIYNLIAIAVHCKSGGDIIITAAGADEA